MSKQEGDLMISANLKTSPCIKSEEQHIIKDLGVELLQESSGIVVSMNNLIHLFLNTEGNKIIHPSAPSAKNNVFHKTSSNEQAVA